MICWIKGHFSNEMEASVSIRDTGLLHSAGVFTTLRADGGGIFRLDQHLNRLRHSCDALFIPLQFSDATLSTVANELLQRNELSHARMRLTVTRGAASNDPVHGLRLEPTVIFTAAELESYPREFYERGMTVMLVDEQKLNPHDIQAGHKTLNYFSRLTALREANRRGAGEGLWFDVNNQLQSGSISNVFLVKSGTLITPPTGNTCTLPGITRQAVLDIASRESVSIEERPIDVNELLEADEVLLTNSIMRVMPVCRIERKAIGGDKPGEITRRLSSLLDEIIGDELRSR